MIALLISLSISILLLSVNGNFLRVGDHHQHTMFPLDMALSDENGAIYQFIQDAMHPHENGAIALIIGTVLPGMLDSAGLNRTSCDLLMVTKLTKHRYMMMHGDVYDISHHRQKGLWKLKRQPTRDVRAMEFTLTPSPVLLNCVEALTPMPMFELVIPYHYYNSGFFNAESGQLGSGFWTSSGNTLQHTSNLYNSSDGSLISTTTVRATRPYSGASWVRQTPPSGIYTQNASDACPQCVGVAGWDGEQYWFTSLQNTGVSMVSQAGLMLNFPYSWRQQVLNSKFYTLNYHTLSRYSLKDGSLELTTTSPHFDNDRLFVVSPDHSRVLVASVHNNEFYVPPTDQHWQDIKGSEPHMLEVDITSGEVLNVRKFERSFVNGGSFDDEFWMARTYTGEVYKFSWNL